MNAPQKPESVSVMLRVSDVALRLDISRSLVYQLVEQGKLSCYRVGLRGGSLRFTDEDVHAYLETCRVEGELVQPERPRLKHVKLR